jgi:hypothetical protein
MTPKLRALEQLLKTNTQQTAAPAERATSQLQMIIRDAIEADAASLQEAIDAKEKAEAECAEYKAECMRLNAALIQSEKDKADKLELAREAAETARTKLMLQHQAELKKSMDNSIALQKSLANEQAAREAAEARAEAGKTSAEAYAKIEKMLQQKVGMPAPSKPAPAPTPVTPPKAKGVKVTGRDANGNISSVSLVY